MDSGKILIADHEGVVVLKFVGDVRLTLCTSLDSFIESLFSRPDFSSIVVDLGGVELIDSTSLGLLAKVALEAKRRFGFQPVLLTASEDIVRLLESMCFDTIFDIRQEALSSEQDFGELPMASEDSEAVRKRILAAHKTLISLSDENAARFRDLVSTLEDCN